MMTQTDRLPLYVWIGWIAYQNKKYLDGVKKSNS